MRLYTFPYPDPCLIPDDARTRRHIRTENFSGDFPITPFIGLELPSLLGKEECGGLHVDRGAQQRLLGRVSARGRSSCLPEAPHQDMYATIGVGFYWWKKHEFAHEFFGYPIDPSIAVNRKPLARPRILRALHVLRQLFVIDTCHHPNALALCWAMARKEVDPDRMERISDFFGHHTTLGLLASLREYVPSGHELGTLKNFLHRGRVRSSRID